MWSYTARQVTRFASAAIVQQAWRHANGFTVYRLNDPGAVWLENQRPSLALILKKFFDSPLDSLSLYIGIKG